MSYDETFREVPIFTDRELYEIPQLQSGEVDLPQAYLDRAIKLEKHIAGPVIQDFVDHSSEEGLVVVVKETTTVLDSSGHEHEVAWCRVCDESGDRHQVICEHVGEAGLAALSEELVFACSGVQMAVRSRAHIVRHVLDHTHTVANAERSYSGRRGIVNFMLSYGDKQPHNWLATHRSDRGNITGLAALFDISERRMTRTASLMALEGDIEITGPNNQAIRAIEAA